MIDNPDLLRTPGNVREPDPRLEHFVKLDGQKIILSDYYAALSEVKLNEYVPSNIFIHFETARNLILYSWFMYRFASVAELQAYSSVEFAINEKAELYKKKDKLTLNAALKLAIKNGWLKDEDFPSYVRREKVRLEYIKDLEGIPGFQPDQKEEKDLHEYCKIISENLPKLRNMLAHGSPYLNTPGNALRTLEICAEIINQLFNPN